MKPLQRPALTRPNRRRTLAPALLCAAGALADVAGVVGARAQTAASAPDGCAAVLADLNAQLAGRKPDALLRAADELEAGRCVAHDEAKANGFLMEAARAGNRQAALRLASKFGRGRGVPQSYANAGAWVGGKGLSDERLGPWDYSVGYAYTIVSEVLAGVHYPALGASTRGEWTFVVEIDATTPGQLRFRRTADLPVLEAAHYPAIEAALAARLVEVNKWLAPPDPKSIVKVRVAVPVRLRYDTTTRAAAFEDEPLLR